MVFFLPLITYQCSPAPPAKPQCGHFTPVPSPVGTPPMARKSRQLATTCSVSWAIETQYLVFIQRPRCTSQGPFDGKGHGGGEMYTVSGQAGLAWVMHHAGTEARRKTARSLCAAVSGWCTSCSGTLR